VSFRAVHTDVGWKRDEKPASGRGSSDTGRNFIARVDSTAAGGFTLARADQHVGAGRRRRRARRVCRQSTSRARRRTSVPRVNVDALQHTLPVMTDIVDQTIVCVLGFEDAFDARTWGAVARLLNTSMVISSSLMPQMQDRVIELARDLERPEPRRPAPFMAIRVARRRCLRRLDRNRGRRARRGRPSTVQSRRQAGLVDDALERRQRNALPLPLRFEPAANSLARSTILASSFEFARSRRRDATAPRACPFTPSSMVQKQVGVVGRTCACRRRG